MKLKKRIGEILIENGTITQEQLQKGLEFQKTIPGKLLGKILIEMGFVTEEDIVVALAAQLNIPYLPIGKDRKSTRLNSSHSAKSRMPSSA